MPYWVNLTHHNCHLTIPSLHCPFQELTPEFYDTRTKGDFLRNANRINFGHRSDGTPVNHVELPAWAENSAEKFVQKLRDALESNFVSKNIHHWIDLIFGYKQRGEEAIKANNRGSKKRLHEKNSSFN